MYFFAELVLVLLPCLFFGKTAGVYHPIVPPLTTKVGDGGVGRGRGKYISLYAEGRSFKQKV